MLVLHGCPCYKDYVFDESREESARRAAQHQREMENFLREAPDWLIVLTFFLCIASGLLVWWWLSEMGF